MFPLGGALVPEGVEKSTLIALSGTSLWLVALTFRCPRLLAFPFLLPSVGKGLGWRDIPSRTFRTVRKDVFLRSERSRRFSVNAAGMAEALNGS